MRLELPSIGCALACLVVSGWLAGCATERLAAAAPGGVNLTGEWKLNPNLSDDPDKMGPDSDAAPKRSPGGHRGRGGRGGGGGMPPMGSGTGGYNYLPLALSVKAPAGLSITQKDHALIVKITMSDGTQTVDEYTAGTSTTIQFGHDGSAERVAGWRGPVFVVTTTVKKGPWREDDYALDDDGRLIVTTQTKGGRRGALEIKRVFDRVRGAAS